MCQWSLLAASVTWRPSSWYLLAVQHGGADVVHWQLTLVFISSDGNMLPKNTPVVNLTGQHSESSYLHG